MTIIETNSALGYSEVAYLIKTNENDFLCIYCNEEDKGDTYRVGNAYELVDYEYQEVIKEKHEMVLKESPLYDTYLLEYFIKNLKD